jgi:hypothetical protein
MMTQVKNKRQLGIAVLSEIKFGKLRIRLITNTQAKMLKGETIFQKCDLSSSLHLV